MGVVSPLSSNISDVVPTSLSHSEPPNNITPCGEAQALWCFLSRDKLWVSSQEPLLERVWQCVLV